MYEEPGCQGGSTILEMNQDEKITGAENLFENNSDTDPGFRSISFEQKCGMELHFEEFELNVLPKENVDEEPVCVTFNSNGIDSVGWKPEKTYSVIHELDKIFYIADVDKIYRQAWLDKPYHWRAYNEGARSEEDYDAWLKENGLQPREQDYETDNTDIEEINENEAAFDGIAGFLSTFVLSCLTVLF